MSDRRPLRVGWLSGVSRVGHCALSPEQRALLDALPVDTDAKLWTNFPYDLAATRGHSDAFRSTWIPLASAVNAARFALACQPIRRRSALAAWRSVKQSCDRLLLITGSCGSQIVRAYERAAPEGAEVELLSLGPVDLPWRPPSAPKQLRVIGAQDRLARRADVTLAEVGHMDYLRSSAVHEVAAQWVRERTGA